MSENRRWYDKDPVLKEALELLRLSTDKMQEEAADFLLNMQNEVAADVIEQVHEMMNKYQGKGNRWYDNDPVMMKAIELLRVAPSDVQRKAALKLLTSLENQESEREN
jgi:hypothetical protein